MIDITKQTVLLNRDCMQVMKALPDHSIDLILTDPPYNISQYSRWNLSFSWRKTDINNDLADWDLVEIEPAELAAEFVRILKPTWNLFIFTSYNLIGKYHEALDSIFNTFQMMIWHKTNPVPNFFKSGFLNSCELIAACWNKGHTWNFKTQKEMHNFFEGAICMGHQRLKGEDGKVLHPTQKPLHILKHIVEIASNPGDLVFDPFMGVWSTWDACKQLDRRFLGTEIDKKYYQATKTRLDRAEEKKQKKKKKSKPIIAKKKAFVSNTVRVQPASA